MEAATVGEVGQWFGIDVIAIKGVTDYIDTTHQDTQEQFEKELLPVSEVVAKEVARIVNWILGKKRSEL